MNNHRKRRRLHDESFRIRFLGHRLLVSDPRPGPAKGLEKAEKRVGDELPVTRNAVNERIGDFFR